MTVYVVREEHAVLGVVARQLLVQPVRVEVRPLRPGGGERRDQVRLALADAERVLVVVLEPLPAVGVGAVVDAVGVVGPIDEPRAGAVPVACVIVDDHEIGQVVGVQQSLVVGVTRPVEVEPLDLVIPLVVGQAGYRGVVQPAIGVCIAIGGDHGV